MDDSPAAAQADYRVDLAVFQGPLDLLLYLIQKDELDIYDIPIARITRQYLDYVKMMQTLNLEVAGEFILMAATLIRIKVRLLLPRDPSDAEEPDPREELIMALLEYKKYKEAADILREKALLEERNYIPPSPVQRDEIRIDWQPATTLFDLLAAFKDVMTVKQQETVHEVNLEEVSIEDRMVFIVHYLAAREFATFAELFADIPKRIVAVVTFIALLELARTQRITIFQSVPFAELRVYRCEHVVGAESSDDVVDAGVEQEEVAI